MLKLEEYKWVVLEEEFNSPLIRNEVWTQSWSHQAKIFKITQIIIGIVGIGDDMEYIADVSTWTEAHEELKKIVEKDMYFVKRLLDDTEEMGQKFNEWTEKNFIKTDLTKLSNKKIIKLLEEFAEKQMMLYVYGTIIPALDFLDFSYIENNMKKFLKEKVPKEEYEQYYRVFTEPSNNSFAQDQEEDLLKLMSKFYNKEWKKDILEKNLKEIKNKHPKFYKELSKHAKKHGWVYYVYVGPAFNEKNFLEFIKTHLKNNVKPENKLEEIKNKKEEIKKLKKEYIEKLKPGEFHKMVLETAGKMVWGKPRRKDFQSKGYYHLEKLLKEVAKRLFISLKQARYSSIPMLKEALKNKRIDVNLINSLMKKHITLPTAEGTVRVITGKEAEEFYKKNVQKNKEKAEQVKELKGATAYPGKVTGTVKVINRPSEMSKMKQGDILVSTATTPSIVPAMKKAGAIVTDSGGITCHASIVSRELGITCVIGVKIGTKVLKDGDIVEVDADKGVVRKK
jgi:phosphoenolpyruvate synthase/pyruvate phosphate dikinase